MLFEVFPKNSNRKTNKKYILIFFPSFGHLAPFKVNGDGRIHIIRKVGSKKYEKYNLKLFLKQKGLYIH